MGIFGNFFGKKEETRTFEDHDWLLGKSYASPTPDNVCGIPAVYSAVNTLSQNIAKLPIRLLQIDKEGTYKLNNQHSVAKLLKLRVNPYQSAYDFMRLLITHYLLYGNAYVDLVYDNRGNVKEMWLLNPSTTSVHIETDGTVWYLSQIPLTNVSIKRSNYEIIHIKNFSTDGLKGKSPIQCAREMLETQMSINSFQNKFYKQGTLTSTVLKTDEMLAPQAKENLRKAWESANSTMTNAHRVAILDGGLTVENIGMPLKDIEFIETQQFNLRQIASIFNIPPHMIGDTSGMKYANIEHQSLSFIRETLQPILTMIEQEFCFKLLKPSETSKYEIRFDTTAVLMGDAQSRASYYSQMIQVGALTINEVRSREGLNPVDNGDKTFIPLNLTTLDNLQAIQDKQLEDLKQSQAQQVNSFQEQEETEEDLKGGEQSDDE